MSLYSVFSLLVILNLRTCACFPVTGVTRIANTVVRANSIGALRVHVTSGRQRSAFKTLISAAKMKRVSIDPSTTKLDVFAAWH